MNIREAIWTLSFSPFAKISEVPVWAVFDCLLFVMYRWGHIESFRFDNGRPFGDPKRESLSPCALLLIGYGCEVVINPPRSPTKNAKVERCQGTTGRWTDFKNCLNIEELRTALDYAVIAQRERLPSRVCENKTRIAYFPSLLSNPRKFNSLDFEIKRIYNFLEKGQWYRKVSKVGQVAIFGKSYQVGFKFRGLLMSIKFRIKQSEPFWICYNSDQELVAEIFAENLANGDYFDLSTISMNE